MGLPLLGSMPNSSGHERSTINITVGAFDIPSDVRMDSKFDRRSESARRAKVAPIAKQPPGTNGASRLIAGPKVALCHWASVHMSGERPSLPPNSFLYNVDRSVMP
jgi:hypothetical protein